MNILLSYFVLFVSTSSYLLFINFIGEVTYLLLSMLFTNERLVTQWM